MDTELFCDKDNQVDDDEKKVLLLQEKKVRGGKGEICILSLKDVKFELVQKRAKATQTGECDFDPLSSLNFRSRQKQTG